MVSLHEIMNQFNVHPFLSISSVAGQYPLDADEDFLDAEEKHTSFLLFLKQYAACASAGLIASTATLDKLLELMHNDAPVQRGEVRRLLEELDGRVRDEMMLTTLLSLNLQEAEHYLSPRKGWEAVTERFPSAIYDIEEGTKCLALGRSTACVFHLMRAAELGLRSLGKALNDQNMDPKRNPSWETILRKCDQELQKPLKERSPEWATDEPFFSTATANLRAIKDAWRNPTMHVERRYSDEEAREVWNATRAFMRHLATKLEEK